MVNPNMDDAEEKPLDPAAERVRRKLVRFVAVNLGILFVAVMAVLGAVVYKSGLIGGNGGEASVAGAPVGSGAILESGEIPLPPGARLVSQALSGNRLSLHVETAEGQGAIFLYDLGEGRMLGSFVIVE
ncbi:fimbrial protein [Aquibium oceanicum]|uniref:Fimbrial protein n=1 Tax=Aquibium oceanicum TaxID=1670800 RepID=A0A1L3SKL0_9HYPH|nr:fimbrial protein [Aquibium oceanicum]APH69954.1 fimbrial protein [Aquibium oceanicum]